MKNILEILGNEYLDKFRVFHQVTLFPPNWESLREHRCPLCFNKLKFPRNNKIAYCRGIKHKKPFIINNKQLIEIVYKK